MKNNDRKYVSLLSLMPFLIAAVPAFAQAEGAVAYPGANGSAASASGNYATALGAEAGASELNATAVGAHANASGRSATAVGSGTHAWSDQ